MLLFSREFLLTSVFSLFRRQLISLTFLCDADGATAHSDPQGINPRVNEVLGLSSSHHCREQKSVLKTDKHICKQHFSAPIHTFMQ